MKVASDCPNKWLSGSRFKKRIGWNGVPHLRYFLTSFSTGTMFERRLRWVISTPLGSAVAPEVKTISARSSDEIDGPGGQSGAREGQSKSSSGQTPAGEKPSAAVLVASPVSIARASTICATR